MLTYLTRKICFPSPSRVRQYIEAFTHGNTSPLSKQNFSYRKGPMFRAILWPNQWSHRVLLGIKWKIWTLSFHWYPLVFCGLSGLTTTVSQSYQFFKKLKLLKIDQFCSAAELNFLTVFLTAVILRPIGIMTWNQGLMKLKIPNIYNMKIAYWYLQPLLR